MFQNNTNNKKETLKNFDDSMKLLLTESIKFFPVSSINRIRRKYKALNILRKDGSLKYFMNELMPFQESVLNKDEKTFLESKTIMVEDPKMVAAWKCLDNSTKEIMWKHLQVLYCLGHQYLQQKNLA
jgi:hypothetical protein|tara:strand:- start:44 stop:424 length:381 start_codon:yes stop_codon:yes gene_type:complete